MSPARGGEMATILFSHVGFKDQETGKVSSWYSAQYKERGTPAVFASLLFSVPPESQVGSEHSEGLGMGWGGAGASVHLRGLPQNRCFSPAVFLGPSSLYTKASGPLARWRSAAVPRADHALAPSLAVWPPARDPTTPSSQFPHLSVGSRCPLLGFLWRWRDGGHPKPTTESSTEREGLNTACCGVIFSNISGKDTGPWDAWFLKKHRYPTSVISPY